MIETSIALFVGVLLGAILACLSIGFLLLSGRITARDIADQCDRLIQAEAEPCDPPRQRSRTL